MLYAATIFLVHDGVSLIKQQPVMHLPLHRLEVFYSKLLAVNSFLHVGTKDILLILDLSFFSLLIARTFKFISLATTRRPNQACFPTWTCIAIGLGGHRLSIFVFFNGIWPLRLEPPPPLPVNGLLPNAPPIGLKSLA